MSNQQNEGRTDAAARARSMIAAGRPVEDQKVITTEHEAAHAVLYLALGYPLHRIDATTRPMTQATPEPQSRPAWDVAVVSMAGIVIEDRYGRIELAERVAEAVDWYESGEDVDELGDMGIFGQFPHLAEDAYVVASLILDGRADLHAEIADALFEHGILTADDIAALPLAGPLLASALGCVTR